MTKKILYIYAATVSYASFIGFLLLLRHNVPMIPANAYRIAAAFQTDGALWLALIGGSIAWIAALVRIAQIRVMPTTPAYEPSNSVYGEPLLEPQGRGLINPKDPKWRDLYKPGLKVQAPAPTPTPVMPAPTPIAPVLAKTSTPKQDIPPYPVSKSAPIDYTVIETANRTADRIRIQAEITKASYRDIGRVKIGSLDIDLVAIADNDIAALLLIDASGGKISATPDYWYSDTKRYANPLPALAAARDALQAQIEKYLPDEGIEAKAFLVLTHGSPANAAEMKKLARDAGVEIVKSGTTVKLPDLLKALPERDVEPDSEFEVFIKTLLDILKKTPFKKAA